MTCILADIVNGKAYMAGDRRLSEDDYIMMAPEPKIISRGGLIIGASGFWSICEEILRYVEIPKIGSLKADEYLKKTYLPLVISALRSLDFVGETSKRLYLDDYGSSVLIICKKELFKLEISNLSIEVSKVNPPYATGSGGVYAISHYDALKQTLNDPIEDLIIRAVKYAASKSSGCDDSVDLIKG